jgi:AraC-like DNA-binding protein
MSNSVIFNSSAHIGGCRFDISMDKSYFDPVEPSAMIHNHADYEVHMIKRGIFSFEINGSLIKLNEGCILVISPNSYHNTADPDNDLSIDYCFRFDHSCFEKEKCILSTTMKGINKALVLDGCEYAIGLADEIFYEYKRKQLDYHKCMDNLIYMIMLYILRRIVGKAPPKENFEYQNHVDENRTTAIDVFFAENHMHDIHSKDLAVYLNLSVRQLDRVLRKHYDMTFKQKLTEIRIFAAKRLLLESSLSVNEISQRVGYNSVENFSSSFSQKTGHTPSSFRKKNLIGS